jgi:predicted P-loop ATPase
MQQPEEPSMEALEILRGSDSRFEKPNRLALVSKPVEGSAPIGWRSQLISGRPAKDGSGLPKAILANAIIAATEAPEWAGVLGFNEFSHSTVTLKTAPWPGSVAGIEWTDHEDRLFANWLQHESIFVSVEVAGQAVQAAARARCFHPVREYLDKLSWDGTPRIDSWLTKYIGATASNYSYAVAPRWLISAVARIYLPGCKADSVLIFEGEQGIKKSTALKILADPWFTDEIADLGSKDAAMQTQGVWIYSRSASFRA